MKYFFPVLSSWSTLEHKEHYQKDFQSVYFILAITIHKFSRLTRKSYLLFAMTPCATTENCRETKHQYLCILMSVPASCSDSHSFPLPKAGKNPSYLNSVSCLSHDNVNSLLASKRILSSASCEAQRNPRPYGNMTKWHSLKTSSL